MNVSQVIKLTDYFFYWLCLTFVLRDRFRHSWRFFFFENKQTLKITIIIDEKRFLFKKKDFFTATFYLLIYSLLFKWKLNTRIQVSNDTIKLFNINILNVRVHNWMEKNWIKMILHENKILKSKLTCFPLIFIDPIPFKCL